MRAAAISLSGLRMDSIEHYRKDLFSLLEKNKPSVAVLPAYSALVLGLEAGIVEPGEDFCHTLELYISNQGAWDDQFLHLHASLAESSAIYLAAGTVTERCEYNGRREFYHTAYCFSPKGQLCGKQRQTHLTRAERELGFSRGEEFEVLDLSGLKTGLIIGNDTRHPESGRILALLGADLILCSSALEAGFNCYEQAAGIWAQVQQNQFWAVEAQLKGNIAGIAFGAGSAIIGPCEITPGKSGYLARGYPASNLVTAELDENARSGLKEMYPLLSMLNPQAYKGLLSEGN
ncbi:MAG: nitrilase-related carbon-nitrogen hydrolase [Bacillota bacterium]